jgi:hypothetical protein
MTISARKVPAAANRFCDFIARRMNEQMQKASAAIFSFISGLFW